MTKIVKKSNKTSKSKFKNAIANSLSEALSFEREDLWDLIQIPKSQSHGQFTLPIPRLLKLYPQQDSKGMYHKISHSVKYVTAQGQFLNFNVNKEKYIEETLLNVFEEKERYGQKPGGQSVLISFGNDCQLRNILLGKFVQNTYESNGYRCITLNNLSDDLGKMKFDSKSHSGDTNSKTNQEMMHNPENTTKEVSDESKANTPNKYKEHLKTQEILYEEEYKRLGVHFDITWSQSEIEKHTVEIYQMLTKKNLWRLSEDSSWAVHLSDNGSKVRKVAIRKADGTGTRFAQDLANIWMCRRKFPDIKKVIFVADIDQEYHFKSLFKVFELLQDLSLGLELVHVAYGKTLGISSGSLKATLDTAKDNMMRIIKEDMKHGKYQEILQEGLNVNGKHVQGEDAVDFVGDTLGISAIVIQNMAVKRVRKCKFSWDKMTDARGDTGIFLQYTHARVCGIERRQKTNVTPRCDFALLSDTESFELVYTISLYPDIVQASLETLDSCSLVLYLFKLAHMISQANYNLRIKDVSPDLAKARLLLFWAAKTTLSNGMKLIGLCPLEKM
ncbi:arginyl-tRNA synthetase [Sporodiniella umbellata]|nr:arginyl-tRNA synthetase [Sporodiniella umbellata]